jgi:hypothetical protein
MSRITKAVLALALAWPALGAADKPKEEPATPAQQYQALQKEYSDALTDFSKAYQAAKTQEERNKIFQEKYPNAAKFAPRFLALAEKNPKDAVAVDALVWVVNTVRQAGGGKDNPRARAVAMLQKHAASDKVGLVCQGMANSADKESEAFLRAVLEKNPKKDIQAQACLGLAGNLKQRLSLRQQLESQPEMVQRLEAFLGKDAVEELRKEDPTKVSKEIEALYDRAVEQYADVKTLQGTIGDQAKKELFEIRFLAIGKQAPEIEGEDGDGKKFKLSDYRGKVVLLDFWGNW